MANINLPPIPKGPYIFLGGTCGNNEWRKEYTRLFGRAWYELFVSTLAYKLPNAQSVVYTSQGLLAPDDIRVVHDVGDIGRYFDLNSGGRYDELFFFDPVVEEWSVEHRRHEKRAKLGAAV
jgi:hypothetical protein